MGFGSDVGLSLAVGDKEVEDDILQAGDIWSTESSSCRRQQGGNVGGGGVGVQYRPDYVFYSGDGEWE